MDKYKPKYNLGKVESFLDSMIKNYLALYRNLMETPFKFKEIRESHSEEAKLMMDSIEKHYQTLDKILADVPAKTQKIKQMPREKVDETIDNLLSTLTYREREIIKLRYGLSDGDVYTLEETGRIFKVTKERIKQIETKATRKLTNTKKIVILEELLQDQ